MIKMRAIYEIMDVFVYLCVGLSALLTENYNLNKLKVMTKLTLCLLACCSMAASAWAQDVPVNRKKYPDYVDPMKAYSPEPRLMKYVNMQGQSESRSMMRKAAADALPDHWNNADTKYFPPVFNQAGGSCGSASRIGYMFTHEINSLRDVDGSLPENQYSTHFVWLFTSGNDGKDQFVEYIGVPNSVVYGGRTYSELFGYQEEGNLDFGWMTGYDKWKHAIGNRMLRPTGNPLTVETEEGRLAAKAWLYNHAGDTDFKAGGLIGLGVASGGNWQRIPKTAANDAAGVTNMYYVYRWGTSVDHAVTMVGWDDRIEFDLDGNGIAGEKDKDEKGAWIIVNSWGGWCNDGFIYCPYKYAGPVSDPETGNLRGGFWSGELYHARKNFRPLRTIKVKMNYSHRSELLLQVGVSTDLNATEPESITDLHHFRYAGDGQNGNADPAPATPMLGKWQGKMNYAPMEFMYDLTDFSANFDQNKPLKYFFIINRKKDTNLGSGNIYEASIVDMESDLDGVESAFDLGGEKFEITKDGKRMMLTAIVYGKGYNSINNLMLSDGILSWSEPNKSSYKVASYNVYKDGSLLGNTKELTYAVEGGHIYAVSAVYEDGTESGKISCVSATVQNAVAANIEKGGFTIPEVFKNTYKECTIEFFIKPTRFVNWNNQAGPGWGSYLQHFNSDGTFTCGWNAPNDRINSSKPFTLNTWQHVAIVVKDNKMTLYRDAELVGSVTSNSYTGIGGFGDFVFQYSNEGVWQNAQYDEIRIWDRARTRTELKGSTVTTRKLEFYGEVLPQGLLAYYKGDTFLGEDGTYYMREYINGNHAPIHRIADDPQVASNIKLTNTNLAAELTIDAQENAIAGMPVILTATRTDAINSMWWNIPACDIVDKHIIAPTVTFAEAGTYQVVVSGRDYKGKEYSDTLQLEVKAAPELDATFSFSRESIPCGEHISMHVNKFTESCGYEWSLPGAAVETVVGAKAGATYEEAGEYTVTLTVTAADGRVASTSQTIYVTSIAPKADFYIADPVVMKGTPASLHSSSRYTPTSYEWILDGTAQKTTITDGQPVQSWTPRYPGRYDVTLKAANAMGEDAITKPRSLVVLNAESGSGLNFSQPGAQVTFPNTNDLNGFTFDFWANPTSLKSSCWGIGKDENTLLLKVNDMGVMTVYICGRYYTSPEGYVEAGMWNHYAVSRSITGDLTFMRNGETISTVRGVTQTKITAANMPTITLSVAGAPINGGIDEFRFWTGSQISKMKDICNQPLENPEEQKSLQVYYDFNQSSGDVIDRSGNGNTGVRTGFGPDGDAWGLSKGVFSLYFGEKQEDEVITCVDEVIPYEPVTAGRTGVYTLSGQYVGRSIKGLPAGLYIIDGKKVVVK